MLGFVCQNIMYPSKIRIVFLFCMFGFYVPIPYLQAQQCSSQLCKIEDLGKGFDYRGQSTFAKFSPGDTCKVQAILYSGNEVKIMTCSDPKLGLVQFKVFRSVREYKRIIDRIEKKEIQEPIYKKDKKGNPIAKLDDWGKPLKDNMGDIQFEITSYNHINITDTIWKIDRKSKDEILFDSRKGSKIFTSTISKTEPIIIEMVIPQSNDGKLKTYKGCVGIMIGRIFKTTNFKGF
jgi:hypothetical protein